MAFEAIQVGKPWPYPLAGEGLEALMEPGEEGVQVTLVAALAKPTVAEVQALTNEPVRLGLLASPPLVWLVLAGRDVSLVPPMRSGSTAPSGRARSSARR